MHDVAILAYGGMSGFEAGIAAEIFGMAELSRPFAEGIPRPWYRAFFCAAEGQVDMIGGATLTVSHGLDDLSRADTIVVPSVADVFASPSGDAVEAVRAAAENGARLVSICSGAFLLAEAGVLDGRQATTHWIYAEELGRRYPRVDVDPRPLYVDAGNVFTSAGCAAGLDLCVHIVRLDRGPRVANDVARRLVIAPHRSGGQAQYVETPTGVAERDGVIAASMAWALDNLDRPIGLDELAGVAHLSRRSYLRQFAAETGTTPIRWLIGQRISASLALLEDGGTPIEEIATSVGFGSAVTFRHHFTRTMHTTPSEYRASFRMV
ncbi:MULTISPECIES: helix-turn-helix domain-containing protein [unclassified Gordonia (in: high G+C Gram-positive bacteria)]|uniref:helix-turn-helix domain-containing protein n=1 Tax=unclassified Gordonia (in: high G+C Gram-positive bacteria) TaxID=2657482 RepID=UPI001F0D8FBE|nr:helix-turn-helix domain-containing protein [Gordonia sp. ABSL49_1]MCH5642072.1 helix-turn-helix domain-containing protein [Gordonia sp. ABSL49_1]